MPFETNVFINCPFDNDYSVLLRPLLFSILYFQLDPKIAQTESSANIRVNQIKQHIRNSKFSIHDLSRSKPMKKNELPRFNMPYELGLDIGCAEFGSKKFKEKRILILETDRFHYQKVLSDISGQDIENHNNDPATIIRKARNWLSTVDGTKSYPSGNKVWVAYNQFVDDLSQTLIAEGFTENEIENMPNSDLISFARDWIQRFTT
ncbi:MAG TPA: hypothetical protein PLS00_05185 [Niabella sp.]|nr:hypothetical protein [Agriterribacter sp.]HUN02227.1 hypothetical protein [Niabella sp.]